MTWIFYPHKTPRGTNPIGVKQKMQHTHIRARDHLDVSQVEYIIRISRTLFPQKKQILAWIDVKASSHFHRTNTNGYIYTVTLDAYTVNLSVFRKNYGLNIMFISIRIIITEMSHTMQHQRLCTHNIFKHDFLTYINKRIII